MCQTLHKITQPKLDSGLYLQKFRSVHPALVLFNKVLWNKNERKQKQQRTDSAFSIKGATHLMILMHINNHAKHIRTRQTNLPTSSRFPFVSWPCDPWCYTNWDRLGSACNFSGSCHVDSRSVCQILPGAPRHDLWEVCHAGVLSRCPTATYGIGTKQWKSWDTHLLFPQNFPHVFQFFSRCLRFPMFFITFSPAFHPFFHRCSPTFPHEIHHFRRGEAVVKLPQLRDGFTAAFQATRQDLVNAACSERIRKDPKGPKSVMWHSPNHWTWLVT